jgi:hypothetical protein
MCGCNDPANGTVNQVDTQYEVRLPDGTVKVVNGEANAKIELTMAGGGSYTRR